MMTEHTDTRTISLDGAPILGQGAYGKVYRKIIDGVPRAIKCLELQDDTEMEKVQNELEVLNKLESDHVVAVFGFQLDNRALHAMIVMELMEGGTLRNLVHNKPLEEQVVVVYLRQLLQGVAFMHEKHVVHRDIKPDNILLDKNGNLKICDLGVAKMIRTIRSDRGMETHRGTPRYMAPEVFDANYGSKADIWSIGATVVHMMTGQMPYPELPEDFQVVFKVGNRSVKYDLQGMATSPMDSFVGRLMAFECTDRPNAPEALQSLEKLQTESSTEEPRVAIEDTGAVARPLSERFEDSNLAKPVARYSEVERRNERMQYGPGTNDRMETGESEEGAAKGILTTGGYSSGRSIQIYSLAANTSRILPTAMREERIGHVSGVLSDGRVMLAGGWNSDGYALSSTELIDPDSLQPTPGPPMNTQRRDASSAVLNGVFYVGGGRVDIRNLLSSCGCEQFRDGKWRRISDMQVARQGHAMVAVDKYIYAIGGRGENGDFLDSVERYCPETDTWQIVTHSIYKLYLAAAECNGYIYVCGGWDENYKSLHICERYSPTANRWQRMADMNVARNGLGLVSVGCKLYAVGGLGDSRSSKSVECYDVGKDKWEMVGELEEGGWWSSAVVVPYS